MDENKIYSYIVSAEVVAKPGSEMWGKAKGAYLYCVVPEKDAEKAAKSTRIALEEDNYDVIQIEEVIKYENMTWESEEVENEYKELLIEAKKSNSVVYGPFFIYEFDND